MVGLIWNHRRESLQGRYFRNRILHINGCKENALFKKDTRMNDFYQCGSEWVGEE